jgi:WD40 repeat protein
MPYVFVSYSRKDIEFAGKIVQALAEKDLDTWIDWKSIPKGEYWEQEIYHGIEKADAFLFLISPDSVRSQMCNKELAHAVENRKRVLPIVIHDADIASVVDETSQQEISKRNWIFCRDGQDNFITAIAETIKTIHTDYEWLKDHTRLQVQALEWERSNHEKSFLLRGKELQNAELQLATNSSKEPYPTDLQREYVFTSRQAIDRQRRTITSIAFVGIIAFAVLAVYGFVQAGRATNAAATAEANAKLALARQLAAQAQSLFVAEDSNQMVAVLLAVQSMKLLPDPHGQAIQVLRNHFLARPVVTVRHYDNVTSVAFSPDGKYVVSAGCDQRAANELWKCTEGFARVWETTTGKEIARMMHDGEVTSVTFSPDGKYVVSGSDDDTARVWEASTGNEIARMIVSYGVKSVAFSPDGKYVLSGSFTYENTARVWEAMTGKEISRMTHGDGAVEAVAFSPDGKYVVSGSYDHTVRVWEAMTGKEISRMTHGDFVYAAAFSPDGKYVVSGGGDALSFFGGDSTARVWEAASG